MANAYIEYFTNQEKYFKIYGNYTIFFTQCGMFFESYQTLEEGYDLQILSNIMNIAVTKKDKSNPVSTKNPYMLGYPCSVCNKYVKILIDNGYTIVLQEQVSPAPKPRREITGIYSPSTYINDITKPDSNYSLTILLEEIADLKTNKKIYIAGLSLIEPSTGYIKIHETVSSINDEKLSLDEIVKFINSFDPREILLITSGINNIKEIICYLELSNRNCRHKTLDEIKRLKGYNNFQTISFQSDLLKKIYKISISPIDNLSLEKYTLGRDAFILSLLDISDHNSNLLTNISKPEIYIKEDKMHLGNNPISQLDIFVKDDKSQYSIDNAYKSLFDIINRTITPMGRRYLKNQLIEPYIDPKKLMLSYDIIEHLQKNYDIYNDILNGIKDTERLDRKINVKNIHPIEFNQWIEYQKLSYQLIELIFKDKILTTMLDDYTKYTLKNTILKLNEMILYINSTFDQIQLEKFLINEITGNIFKEGKYIKIDNLQESINLCNNFMVELAKYFDTIIKKKLTKLQDIDTVKIESNERDGYFLILSTKRSEFLEIEINKNPIIELTLGNKIIKIKTSSIKFEKKGKGSNTKIFCDIIKEKSDKINEYIDEIKIELKNAFISELDILINSYESNIKTVTNFISQFDFLLSGAKCANKFFYNKPIINNKFGGKSFFKASQLRHPIIERINTDIEYIPTDIELGTYTNDSNLKSNSIQDGILLFGLNSAGKSTLQKAVGIAILMSQIGYFVPATTFEFYPYNAIFTRISANDNLFKGLSSYGLELSELTSILKRNSKNTLIIADEICKGTEHKSSLIIVMTIIKMLSESQTSFITATHLHDICNFTELDKLNNVKKYHLHVDYDESKNKLIYDRTLKEGSGSSYYGLLVAKCIINDIKFSTYTNEIEKELNGMILSSDKKSKYNSKLYIQCCAICKKIPKEDEIPLETHHINFQRNCDENGFIKTKKYLHKNNMSNLVVLCHKCHDSIDTGLIEIDGYKDTSDGKELNYIIKNQIKYNLSNINKINSNLNIQIKNLLHSISQN